MRSVTAAPLRNWRISSRGLRGGRLHFNKTGAENETKWHEKGTNMGPQLNAKSIRCRGGVREAFREAETFLQ